MDKFPAECLEVLKRINQANPLCDAERDIFGTTHAQVGAYLLGIWGLSEPIVKTVAYHHTPCVCPTPPNSLAAVYLANIFERKRPSGAETESVPELDADYLEMLGIDRVAIWRRLCSQTGGEDDACQNSVR